MYSSITALASRQFRRSPFSRSLVLLLGLSMLALCWQLVPQSFASGKGWFKKREVTAQICGQLTQFQPASTLGSGFVQLNSATTYRIAPGVVIGGQALLSGGQNICIEAVLNNNGDISFGSAVAGSLVSVCGAVENYRASTFITLGTITINGTAYPIATGFALEGNGQIANGANMCLTGVLNGSGQLTRPSLIAANLTPSLTLCGVVNAYVPATATVAGGLNVAGMAFTVAPGAMISGLTVGSNQCLSAFTDGFGRIITPSSAGANASGATQICGVVTDFQAALTGREGFIRLGHNLLPIGDSVRIGEAQIGASVCLNLVIANGRVANGSSLQGAVQECPQFTVPTLVHGFGEFNQDLYALPNLTVFTVSSSQAGGAMNFSVNGGFPGYDARNIAGLAASSPNSVVKAVSCTDSFWDFIFSLGTKGMVEGDMIKLTLQSPGSQNGQLLAMFTVQNGGLVLNSVSPWLSLRANGSSNSVSVGRFFPVVSPGPGGFQYTTPFVMVFAPDSRSPFNGCFQFAVELKRAGGNGMLAFVPLQSIVKRMDDTVGEGPNLDNGSQGTFPTAKPCQTVCQPCNDQPPPTSLSGFVYCDLNNDGLKQSTEPALANVTVTLTGTSITGPVNIPTTTDANGAYSFNNLRPGTYTITETQPNIALDGVDTVGSIGGTLGNDVIANIQVSTTSGANYNFGEICTGALAGFVYCDSNNNGMKDAGEGGLSGVTITLTGTSVMGAVNLTLQTGADGSYGFNNLAPGTYTLTETQPAGYGDGLDKAGSLGGTVANDVISGIAVNNNQGQGYNFGEGCNRGLRGFVYCDGNNDGVRQAGEPGIVNVTVTLTGTTAQGAVNLVAATDGNGNYGFTNLQPGTYTLTETQPNGYGDGKDTAGTLGGTVGNDVISSIVVVNADGIDYAFGERCGGNLSGYVYCDTNNDGVRQPAEGGVPGVTITLSGAASRVTTTDNSGNYSFANLSPGTYAITETQPIGFGDGKDTLGSLGGTLGNDTFTNIVLTNTDGVNYAFGEACPGGLNGSVYCDFNDDGIRQTTENGIAAVTVMLAGTDANGPITRLTTTNLFGFYSFPNLLPGTYKITELQPPGNVDGKDMVGTLGGIATNDMFASIVVNSNIGTDYNFGEACMPTKCDTICYITPREWILRGRYPNGAIIVGGINFNNPISIQRNIDLLERAMRLGATGMQALNREFIAMQLSHARAGGLGSPVVFNTYWSPLRCTGLNFAPVTLSNGYIITPDTLLNDLVLQTQATIRENRIVDMQALADLLAVLNTKC